MKRPRRICFLFVYFFLLFFQSAPVAQFSINTGIETGAYTLKSSFAENNDNFLLSVNGQLKYLYKEEKNTAALQLNLNPQLYGITNPLLAFKLKAQASYAQRFDSYKWSIDLLKRNYFFSSGTTNTSYDIYYIQTMLDWKLTSSIPFQSLVGFAYQDISSGAKQQSDLIFTNNKAFINVDAFNQFCIGFYAERYLNQQDKKFSGWRIGPQLGFNHLKKIIFRAEYRMLMHVSKIITQFSHEHWIRLLAGKMLTPKWSLFLLADINLREMHTEENTSLAYSVIDSENHVYLKLSYEPTETMELTFKSGYFKENYFINDARLEGWNFTFGIILKK